MALQEVNLGWSNMGNRTGGEYKYRKNMIGMQGVITRTAILTGYFTKEDPGSAFLQDEPGFNIIERLGPYRFAGLDSVRRKCLSRLTFHSLSVPARIHLQRFFQAVHGLVEVVYIEHICQAHFIQPKTFGAIKTSSRRQHHRLVVVRE